jgi:hypothetical protein
MLSAAEHDYRIGKFTGSLANAVMNATTEAELVKVWRVKVGLDEPEPENWPMRLGSHCEQLILDENERQSGHKITRRGDIVDHPTVPNVCAKLDGFRSHDNAVMEAKLAGAYRTREEIFRAYYPQVALQMSCLNCQRGYLVVAQSTSDPYEVECVRDAAYEAELLHRASAFLVCMQTFTPPCVLPPIIPPDLWVVLDVVEKPTNWSAELLELLAEFEKTSEAADRHDEAGAAARALIPPEAGKVYAGAHTISRDRRGILKITATSARRRRAA